MHHKHHQEGTGQSNESHPAQAKDPQKKESEIHKLEDDFKKDEQEFKNYLKKDEEMQEEGKEYGGLM